MPVGVPEVLEVVVLEDQVLGVEEEEVLEVVILVMIPNMQEVLVEVTT